MARRKTAIRQAAPRARARAPAPVARRAPRRNRSNVALKNGVAALVGGAGGALAGGLLVKAGIKPTSAAVGITVAGAVGTITLTGTSRAVSAGVASAGAGQLALGWLAKVRNEMPEAEFPLELPSAHEIESREFIDVDDAFRQARNQFEHEEEDEDDILVEMEAA